MHEKQRESKDFPNYTRGYFQFARLIAISLSLTGSSWWWQALDHVIAESRQHGIRLLLSLVNNLQAYGGKTQYVKWAWQDGVGLSSSNDSFFYDPSIRIYFKNYIKVHIDQQVCPIFIITWLYYGTISLEKALVLWTYIWTK